MSKRGILGSFGLSLLVMALHSMLYNACLPRHSPSPQLSPCRAIAAASSLLFSSTPVASAGYQELFFLRHASIWSVAIGSSGACFSCKR
ncbi:hypothetical protein V8F06_012943 [Rhypophila decipiens]